MQQRRDTAANWTSNNPVLAAGEIGFETDTLKTKVGNGSSAWTSLSYIGTSTGLTTTVSSTTPVVLTATSNYYQRTTGSSTQTYTLPVATTLTNGTTFIFDVDTTQQVTINDSTSSLVDKIGRAHV